MFIWKDFSGKKNIKIAKTTLGTNKKSMIRFILCKTVNFSIKNSDTMYKRIFTLRKFILGDLSSDIEDEKKDKIKRRSEGAKNGVTF